MVQNLEDALCVARYILNDEVIRQRFEELCEERHLDKDFLELTAKVHVYGMAKSAIEKQDHRSLSKCCRYILSNEELRRDFKQQIKQRFGDSPISIKKLSDFEHIFTRALSGLGSNPSVHFPYLFIEKKVAS